MKAISVNPAPLDSVRASQVPKPRSLRPQRASTTRPLESRPCETLKEIETKISQVVRGKRDVIQTLLSALLARGHVLIEDVPGVGKTTLARALSICLGASWRRIQGTSDMLPSDLLGVTIYRGQSEQFEFRPGPIFANVVLVDEINRMPPRTQSALLEVMSEGQVSVDGHTYPLPQPFLVIATQNPTEQYGAYPLPESQLDRFLVRTHMGYPRSADERLVLLERGSKEPVTQLTPHIDSQTLAQMQEEASQVHLDEALIDYALAIVESTRHTPLLSLGISTRGALAWCHAAKAHALLCGRSFCTPDDLKRFAIPVLAHRVMLAGQLDGLSEREEAERIIRQIVEQTPVPL